MEKKNFTCIVCPVGCHLEAIRNNDGSITVAGNTCPRGEAYAKTELTAPVRTLTTTVRLVGGTENLLPVKTSVPIPKEDLLRAMKEIRHMRVEAPVRRGDAVVSDFLFPGVSLLAGRDIATAETKKCY